MNGSVGIIVAPRGRMTMVHRCTIKSRKIVEMDVIANPVRLNQLDLAVLNVDGPTYVAALDQLRRSLKLVSCGILWRE